jgi:hypothetical protein
MSLDQALEIISQVCSKAVGNLADHQAIQKALGVITDAVKPKEPTDEVA